jgi:hypothetical protein
MLDIKEPWVAWVQLGKPFLIMDLLEQELGAFSKEYSYLEE